LDDRLHELPRRQQLDADLIVIGHSGHSAILDRFLGSTPEKISRHAPARS